MHVRPDHTAAKPVLACWLHKQHHSSCLLVQTNRLTLANDAYFSSRTGGLFMRVILLQYQIMMMRMLGVRKVFMANHTWVKPPFWWMLCRKKLANVSRCYRQMQKGANVCLQQAGCP